MPDPFFMDITDIEFDKPDKTDFRIIRSSKFRYLRILPTRMAVAAFITFAMGILFKSGALEKLADKVRLQVTGSILICMATVISVLIFLFYNRKPDGIAYGSVSAVVEPAENKVLITTTRGEMFEYYLSAETAKALYEDAKVIIVRHGKDYYVLPE